MAIHSRELPAQLAGAGAAGAPRAESPRPALWRTGGLLLLGVFVLGSPGTRLWAFPPPKPTPEQRDQWRREAQELQRQADQFYRKGQAAAASKLLERLVQLLERAYAPDEFPLGHPDLVRGLNDLGFMLGAHGQSARAQVRYERALHMGERLYPPDAFPRGHPDLANSIQGLGVQLARQGDFAGARSYLERAVRMREQLYPPDEFPRGHAELAGSLDNLGFVLQVLGEYARARVYLERAMRMREKLYPPNELPRGHPLLATSLYNLGLLFRVQGEYAQALGYYERALQMDEALHPPEQFPRGDPDLALTLLSLGRLVMEHEDYDKARAYLERALQMCERLYPPEEFPRGHPSLASSLDGMGMLLNSQGEYPQARPYHERALRMRGRLYPPEEYPRGHANLALSLNNLGILFWRQGDYDRAQPYLERAVQMYEKSYPPDECPHGHPELARSVLSVCRLHQSRKEYAQALADAERGLTMYQELAETFATGVSEAEALTFVASLPGARDALLSMAGHVPDAEERSYRHLWRSKAAVTRILERCQQALGAEGVLARLPADHPERDQVRKARADLLAVRRELSRMLLAPGRDREAHRRRVRELSEAKDQLERRLAELVPAYARQQDLERRGPAALIEQLPARTAFIDLVRYVRWEQDPKVKGKAGLRWTPCYTAFMLGHGRPVRRVELSEAAPIDRALEQWRRDLADQKTSPAAKALRQLVWEPLARCLPADTQTVLLAPDGALTRLPWAALPGTKPGTVLLEEVAVALVPHGPFLLEQLAAPAEAPKGPGLLLAVGGVQYDPQPQPSPRPADAPAVARPAERGQGDSTWPYLPGTVAEVDRIVALAKLRPVRVRRGTEASTAQVLADLPQARWVHLATHGFFADAKLRSVLQLDESLFAQAGHGRAAPGARNPMVLSGLVLARANLPPPTDDAGLLHGDGGILTAEVIAGLPLHNLELAVLSACETGLGEVAGGEGVFGLQRAFHLAGAQTVVASLWRVDDRATQALMVEFYRNLWEKKLSKLEALRQAQLALLRRYDAQAGALRGFQEAGAVDPKAKESARERAGQAPPFLWAGFVLSRDWR